MQKGLDLFSVEHKPIKTANPSLHGKVVAKNTMLTAACFAVGAVGVGFGHAFSLHTLRTPVSAGW